MSPIFSSISVAAIFLFLGLFYYYIAIGLMLATIMFFVDFKNYTRKIDGPAWGYISIFLIDFVCWPGLIQRLLD